MRDLCAKIFFARTILPLACFVIRVGVDLVGVVKAPQRVLVGRRDRHGANRAVLDHVQNGFVELRMRMGGHGDSQGGLRRQDESQLNRRRGA